MNNQLLLDNLRCIPDWPIKGVNFRDVSTLFKNPASLKEISDEMYELYKDKGITKIVGIESRGFVMSSALAIRLGAGVVLCFKLILILFCFLASFNGLFARLFLRFA
jgi:adenine phosphoribosyltransferase